jgi:hypothetical protein
MVLGAVRAYFWREVNHSIRAAPDLTAFTVPNGLSPNEIEDQIIICELLDRATTFPQLRPPVRRP